MNEQILEKMRKLRLFGMHRAFKTSLDTERASNFTADEMITFLIDSEWDDRYNRTIERSLRNARFRYKSTVEQVDYAPQETLIKTKYRGLQRDYS